jgi:hypothetical protein
MAVLPILLSLVVAPAGPALRAEESAVIEAVAQYLDLKIADKTLALSSERWPLSDLVQKAPSSVSLLSKEFLTFDGTHLTVSDELIEALRENNKKSMAIKDLARSHATRQFPSVISRPGISRDGLKALVVEVIAGGSGGSLVYVEKQDGRWNVIGVQQWFS